MKNKTKKVLFDELKDFDEIWDEKPAEKRYVNPQNDFKSGLIADHFMNSFQLNLFSLVNTLSTISQCNNLSNLF